MRIVAGRHRSRPLRTPPGEGTRPTSDRVRESLFAALQSLGMLDGARVLDVCAGSGALGLESLSRGAASVVFVERAVSVAKVIAGNIASLGEQEATTVLTRSAAPALADLAEQGDSFDVVLADPPYPMPEAQITRLLASAAQLLADDASLIVLERSTRSPAPETGPELSLFDTRTYGETVVYMYERSR